MAKHIVFLVHGMGNFEKDWSISIRKQIKDAFQSYKRVAEQGAIADFDFVEITYNQVFESWRKQWREDADAAASAATALGLNGGMASKLVALAKAPTGDSFLQTHLVDVAMFWGLTQVSEEVCQQVRLQILSVLKSSPQNDIPKWSVIAHSLGTAVTTETLHKMFTHSVDGVPLPDVFRPEYIFAVANVSKLLWNKGGDFYGNEVRPHVLGTQGMCWKFGNFHHALDPFCHLDPFSPPDYWFPAHVDRSRVYDDVELDAKDIQNINVHDFGHYLSHPDVHVPIISTLLNWPELIEPGEKQEALKKWRKARLSEVALGKAKKQLGSYVQDKATPLKDALGKLQTFLEDVRGTFTGENT